MKRQTASTNRRLAAIFSRMADCYRYLGPDQRFRAMAYTGAAQTLRNLSEPVEKLARDIRQLEDLKSIGSSIAGKIGEYLATGRIKTYEALKKQVPYALMELMDIEGFGPATLRQLHEELGIDNTEELIAAIRDNKLRGIKGFGEKRIEKLRQALKLEEAKTRYPLSAAEKLANRLLRAIRSLPGVEEATLAGSIRRQKETIGDIDIVLTAPDRRRRSIVRGIATLPLVESVIMAGTTKVSVRLKPLPMQADIRLVHADEYGAALFYFTGSKEHNIHIRGLARARGWKMNEYGVFDQRTGKRLAGHSEEEIYRLFHLDWIPPKERTGDKEFVNYARPARKNP